MPRRNIDTAKLEQLAKNFYERSQISNSDDTIKDAAIKGIQHGPITSEELLDIGGIPVSAEQYFGRTQHRIDKARYSFSGLF